METSVFVDWVIARRIEELKDYRGAVEEGESPEGLASYLAELNHLEGLTDGADRKQAAVGLVDDEIAEYRGQIERMEEYLAHSGVVGGVEIFKHDPESDRHALTYLAILRQNLEVLVNGRDKHLA